MENDKAPIQLIVFKLGNEFYGVRIEQIKEVTFTPPLSKMPKTPDFLKGLANIRGEIIAILDLEERLGIVNSKMNEESTDTGYTLVIEKEDDYTIGLIVKEIPFNLKVPVHDLKDSLESEFISTFNKEYIEGIARNDDKLIIVLNISNILSDEEVKMLYH